MLFEVWRDRGGFGRDEWVERLGERVGLGGFVEGKGGGMEGGLGGVEM